MIIIEHPRFENAKHSVCPICGTSEDKPVTLVSLCGTLVGYNIEAIQVHVDCVDLTMGNIGGLDVIYMVVENEKSRGLKVNIFEHPKRRSDMNKVKRTERGWAGHYIAASSCRFRRNTLLESGDVRIVVSTVGALAIQDEDKKWRWEEIGTMNRMYETMIFHAVREGEYWEADTSRQIDLEDWTGEYVKASIHENCRDNEANLMHDNIVDIITERLANNSIGGGAK